MNHTCIICNGNMQPYLQKENFVSTLKEINTKNLLPIIYSCCENSGIELPDRNTKMSREA